MILAYFIAGDNSQEYGVTLHWRPVARPHYGGHIERLLGTLNHEIHNLPGSTFSNPQARGAYKAYTGAMNFSLSHRSKLIPFLFPFRSG